jgi:pyruvate dehydrogenase E1 component alpha subunit
MTAEIFGKETGCCRGLGGSMHIADISKGNLGGNGIVGGGISLGVGAALGAKIRKEDRVTVIFFSDGAANNGIFPESLNLASVWNLPVIFICENNHYAAGTPIELSSRSDDLYKIGTGYSVDSSKVDGNDVLDVYEAAREAAAKCRAGKGPVMLEAKTYRSGGHHVNDSGDYMPKERLDYFLSRDPVLLGKRHAMTMGKAVEADMEKIDDEVKITMENAIDFAKKSADMSPEKFLKLIENY